MNKSQTTRPVSEQRESSPQKPRKLQDIFNLMIDVGFYGFGAMRHAYMCYALDFGKQSGVLTSKEYIKAIKAINTYLEHLGGAHKITTLQNGLLIVGLPHNFAARHAIYRNWAKRPKRKTNTKSG